MKPLMCAGLVAVVLGWFPSAAHPGVGIVEDSKGNIFYTDLAQVWKIAPDGQRSVVVKNVHTHELFIDGTDNLYGEHLWYNGERANTWGHYVWKLSPNGAITKVIPDKEGFLEGYSFVRDHLGRMYWADRTGTCQKVTRRNADNSLTQLGDQCFSNIRFMKASAKGGVYVVDFQDLKTVDELGKVRTVATQIADRKITQFTVSNQHSVMGVWDDKDGNIYTAIASGRMVKRFTPAGKEEIVVETTLPWSPSGGLVDARGNLWVLEFSITNEVRVEKIEREGKRKVFD